MYLRRLDLYQVRWSDRIHYEWIEAVLRHRPDIRREQLERTRALMERNSPGSIVAEYHDIEAQLKDLPDPGDAHVIAAAVKGGAQAIITHNLRHFPQPVLSAFGLVAQYPDDFLCELFARNPGTFCTAVRLHRTSLIKPPKTVEEYLFTLRQQGLEKTATLIQESGQPI